MSAETTVVGCLTTGNSSGEYILTDYKDPERRTVVRGNPDLARHTPNHAVRIVGPVDRENQSLKAIRIEHIAVSCRTPF